MLIAVFVVMRTFWPASIQELGTTAALQSASWATLGWVLMGLFFHSPNGLTLALDVMTR